MKLCDVTNVLLTKPAKNAKDEKHICIFDATSEITTDGLSST